MTVRWLADALCVGWLTSARFVGGAVRWLVVRVDVAAFFPLRERESLAVSVSI